MALTAPFAAAASRAGSAVRSAGLTAAAYAIIGLIGLIGAGFLLAALFIWIAANTDPLVASLVLGFGFLAIAVIGLAIVMARAQTQKRHRRSQTANTAMMASTVSLATTGLRLASRVKGPLFWPAVAAIAAGWYLSSARDDEED